MILVVDQDASRILTKDPSQYIHQSGFSGPVFTQQAVNLSLADGQRDVLQRLDRIEALVDVLHFQMH